MGSTCATREFIRGIVRANSFNWHPLSPSPSPHACCPPMPPMPLEVAGMDRHALERELVKKEEDLKEEGRKARTREVRSAMHGSAMHGSAMHGNAWHGMAWHRPERCAPRPLYGEELLTHVQCHGQSLCPSSLRTRGRPI